MRKRITKEELNVLNKYFNLANYLSVGQLYLWDNPLLKRELKIEDIKPKLVGHWGTVPGQNFIYTHLNRIIKNNNLDMIYISGPGHGGNSQIANTYIEGTYSEVYPNITEDEEGLKKLFKQFSFPGGVSSHDSPEVPGSISEGGELGYSLAHAYGAVLDNPKLIVACIVGDGEAETGPLATSWHLNKFINPVDDGIVLPILHLNGYKIANPTIMGRMTDEELAYYFKGLGYRPYLVEGKDTMSLHKCMAEVLDMIVEEYKKIKKGTKKKVNYPMIVLRTPKGWTGPKTVDGKQIEGSFRAHQIPLQVDKDHLDNLKVLEKWLLSYKPEELFDNNGKIKKEVKYFVPSHDKRMGASKYANGGKLLEELKYPDFTKYKVYVKVPGETKEQDMKVLGNYVRDLIILNRDKFKVFGPDESLSNRLNYVFEQTNRKWNSVTYKKDEYLNTSGSVIDSFLSEHVCEGMLEGYLLTGRHGFFHCYEAFIRIIDSMVSQHAKWLKMSSELPWREDIASLNYILSSHIWQQDHNGYTHQDPGFLNHIVTKKADTVRAYLPPDANCLLSCFDHVVRTKNYINVIVASKHPSYQWLTMEQAIIHCTKGIGVWDFASNDQGEEPDIVMASCGDTPTVEVLAAIKILREHYENIKIRMVNVVDLMKLQSNEEHPHGLTNEEYDMIFTKNKPIIFAFHGYPNLIHQLTYKRNNKGLHVHGYQEEGTITTAFDMRVLNKLDRYNLVLSALKYLPKLKNSRTNLSEYCENKLIEHKNYIKEYGVDMDEIINWKWEE